MKPDPEDAARSIVSTRVLPFPREQVFRAVAEPERLTRWWGPAGFTSSFQRFEFREGGEWHFVLHGPDGKDYPNRVVFDAIEPPARLVLRHVPGPHFVLTMTLAEEAGATRLRWHMLFEDAQVRDQLAPVCVPANEQNFDRLHAELSSHP
jgi:uncharacterized protein YndB with AHSA1/START domain